MITSSVRELSSARARVRKLEEALSRELASLPDAYGFASIGAFIAALRTASGADRRRTPKKPAPKSRKRAVITDAVRSRVKKLAKSGKTGAQIARTAGISLPSVQNIKKALGLVKGAKKAPGKPKPKRAQSKPSSSPKVFKAAPTKTPAPGPKLEKVAPAIPATPAQS
jgi:hypothetical protein